MNADSVAWQKYFGGPYGFSVSDSVWIDMLVQQAFEELKMIPTSGLSKHMNFFARKLFKELKQLNSLSLDLAGNRQWFLGFLEAEIKNWSNK